MLATPPGMCDASTATPPRDVVSHERPDWVVEAMLPRKGEGGTRRVFPVTTSVVSSFAFPRSLPPPPSPPPEGRGGRGREREGGRQIEKGHLSFGTGVCKRGPQPSPHVGTSNPKSSRPGMHLSPFPFCKGTGPLRVCDGPDPRFCPTAPEGGEAGGP